MIVMVAHPAQQHSYRLAEALKKAGMLSKYATTVYYKKPSLTWLAACFLRGKFRIKAGARHSAELSDAEVIQFCEGEGLLKLLALNTRFFNKYYRKIKYHTADRFAKKAAKYAIRHKVDAVVTYDDTSPILFEVLKRDAPNILRILDVSAASTLYMRSIYEKDIQLAPRFGDRLRRERKIVWNPEMIERTKREFVSTQKFLVPSKFVARSLEYSDVQKQQMYLCPYGVDISQFSQKKYDKSYTSGPLKFIYVGGIKELKGIFYLFEAFKQIPKTQAVLTVVGQADITGEDVRPYLEYVNFTGSVIHSDVPKLLHQADIFVFPSLGEGMSLSVLEAAACGLPLIVSENSGVDDITDGKEGFVIPIQSVEAIKEKAVWFVHHPQAIEIMGNRARQLALKYTWNSYDSRAADIFKSFEIGDSGHQWGK